MKAKLEHKVCGIYCIRNMINNKVYIGKAINIHQRIIAHKCALRKKYIDENTYLINAWHKYGEKNFEYFVIEILPLDEEIIAKRELYWMKIFKALNPEYGYNLRADSDSKMLVHDLTRLKISKRLKSEWANGVRSGHAEKLKTSWSNDAIRKEEQSKRLSKTLTKWKYEIYTLDLTLIEIVDFKRLKELGLIHCQQEFYKKKTDKVKHKKHLIVRIKIEDIV